MLRSEAKEGPKVDAEGVVIPDPGGVYFSEDGTASVVLEDNYDPNYEPSEKEILEYAQWLGLDPEQDKELLWIAREGLKAPLPENWRPCKTDSGEIYYFNFSTGESLWDHPMDDYYKDLYTKEKKKLMEGGTSKKPDPEGPAPAAASTPTSSRKKKAVGTPEPDLKRKGSKGAKDEEEDQSPPPLAARGGRVGFRGLKALKPSMGGTLAAEDPGLAKILASQKSALGKAAVMPPLGVVPKPTKAEPLPVLAKPLALGTLSTPPRSKPDAEEREDKSVSSSQGKLKEVQEEHEEEVRRLKSELERKKADTLRQLQKEADEQIGELEKLLDAKKAEVQRTRSEELEALRRAAEAQKEERERQFQQELRELEGKFEREKEEEVRKRRDQLEQELERRLKALKDDNEDAVASRKRELEKEKRRRVMELEEECDREVQARKKELKTRREEMERQHGTELETLHGEWQARMRRVQEEEEQRLAELKAKFAEASTRMGTEQEALLEEKRIRQGSVEAMKAELQEFERQLEGQKQEQKGRLQREMAETMEQWRREETAAMECRRAELQTAHQQALQTLSQELEAKQVAEKSALAQRHTKELEAERMRLQAAHEAELTVFREAEAGRLAAAKAAEERRLEQQLEELRGANREHCRALLQQTTEAQMQEESRRLEAELEAFRRTKQEAIHRATQEAEQDSQRRLQEELRRLQQEMQDGLAKRKAEHAEQLGQQLQAAEAEKAKHLQAQRARLEAEVAELKATYAEQYGREKAAQEEQLAQRLLAQEKEFQQRERRAMEALEAEMQGRLAEARRRQEAALAQEAHISEQERAALMEHAGKLEHDLAELRAQTEARWQRQAEVLQQDYEAKERQASQELQDRLRRKTEALEREFEERERRAAEELAARAEGQLREAEAQWREKERCQAQALEARLARRLEELQAQHQHAMADLEQHATSEGLRAAQQQQQRELAERFGAELAQLTAEHEAQLQAATASQHQRLQAQQRELEAQLQAERARHDAAVRAAEAEYTAAAAEHRRGEADAGAGLAAAAEAELHALRQHHAQRLEEAKRQLEEEHRAKLAEHRRALELSLPPPPPPPRAPDPPASTAAPGPAAATAPRPPLPTSAPVSAGLPSPAVAVFAAGREEAVWQQPHAVECYTAAPRSPATPLLPVSSDGGRSTGPRIAAPSANAGRQTGEGPPPGEVQRLNAAHQRAVEALAETHQRAVQELQAVHERELLLMSHSSLGASGSLGALGVSAGQPSAVEHSPRSDSREARHAQYQHLKQVQDRLEAQLGVAGPPWQEPSPRRLAPGPAPAEGRRNAGPRKAKGREEARRPVPSGEAVHMEGGLGWPRTAWGEAEVDEVAVARRPRARAEVRDASGDSDREPSPEGLDSALQSFIDWRPVGNPSSKWTRERLQAEHDRIRRAKAFLKGQRRELRARQRAMEEARAEWQGDMERAKHGSDGSSLPGTLARVRRLLERQAKGINEDVELLLLSERWLRLREQKIRLVLSSLDLSSGDSLHTFDLDRSASSIHSLLHPVRPHRRHHEPPPAPVPGPPAAPCAVCAATAAAEPPLHAAHAHHHDPPLGGRTPHGAAASPRPTPALPCGHSPAPAGLSRPPPLHPPAGSPPPLAPNPPAQPYPPPQLRTTGTPGEQLVAVLQAIEEKVGALTRRLGELPRAGGGRPPRRRPTPQGEEKRESRRKEPTGSHRPAADPEEPAAGKWAQWFARTGEAADRDPPREPRMVEFGQKFFTWLDETTRHLPYGSAPFSPSLAQPSSSVLLSDGINAPAGPAPGAHPHGRGPPRRSASRERPPGSYPAAPLHF